MKLRTIVCEGRMGEPEHYAKPDMYKSTQCSNPTKLPFPQY